MRKVYWFTAAAILILAGIVGWTAPTTHARVNAPTTTFRLDTLQLMSHAKSLSVEDFEDYSLVFH